VRLIKFSHIFKHLFLNHHDCFFPTSNLIVIKENKTAFFCDPCLIWGERGLMVQWCLFSNSQNIIWILLSSAEILQALPFSDKQPQLRQMHKKCISEVSKTNLWTLILSLLWKQNLKIIHRKVSWRKQGFGGRADGHAFDERNGNLNRWLHYSEFTLCILPPLFCRCLIVSTAIY